ncbi:protein of unknown function DUF1080 [Hymenobacter roseosalivarius DSM 11622]|uniref:3-keto-alpha-glucoside-1,2-lyase/3-keto-2-hydroxy-glucal hydratase domain-containing protein n=1 Tax=Hymenobacter roseosalivarius DSM 11622 TaxID=645990 RepID=A0A1W1VZ25_9BACT|nr:DUF1080 domain-containing protein [Hymenobacter roseosalivarius]SMB98361.1 protein of unknown function DUF1080 [Hymenobacter roseosalivarius DSM 11622]
MRSTLLASVLLFSTSLMAQAQQKGKPEDTEVWEPVPKVVATSPQFTPPPSDALVLFDGKDLTQWVSADDRNAPAKWKVAGGIFTVDKKAGNIETKRTFTNYQLHLEWRVPATIAGTGQVRGNSGLFLASLGKGDLGYELQILDSYQNKTYVNGMAGSIYKQLIPLANPTRKPGEWQSYDVLWTAPTFKADGSVQSPACVTVLFNGVVVQNNVTLAGPTVYIGKPSYQKHGPAPIKLQSHGDPSEPLSFRNIWIREL